MARVIVLDKDVHTINSITAFLEVFGIETLVVHNWPSHIKNLDPQSISAIIVDVELRSIHLDKLREFFNSGSNQSPPFFYLYSRSFAPRYVEAKEHPFAGDFKKPLQLTELYETLGKYLSFQDSNMMTRNSNAKLSEFQDFKTEFTKWVDTFGMVLNKAGNE